MKRLTFLTVILVMSQCLHCYGQLSYPADSDTMSKVSINNASLGAERCDVKVLAKLGMLWGFIKYYHPNVAKGRFNMDTELFRELSVLSRTPSNQADSVLEAWIDYFGVFDTSVKVKEGIQDVHLAPDYSHLFDTQYFRRSLIEKLETVRKYRSASDNHYYIGYGGIASNPDFRHESLYANADYPNTGLSLLALYRYWNMIQYFYPNKHLIGEDWSRVLTKFIPIFLEAKTDSAYFVACTRLIARINDSHAHIWGLNGIYYRAYGQNTIPISSYFIENKLLVTSVQDTLNLQEFVHSGDVISDINDIPVEQLIEQKYDLASESNHAMKLWRLSDFRSFLFWNSDSTIKLTLEQNNGKRTAILPKAQFGGYYRRKPLFESDSAYRLLAGNIGYIYPIKLEKSDVEYLKNNYSQTKGLIIDLRGYPKSLVPYTFADWLKKEESVFCLVSTANLKTPGLFTISKKFKNGRPNKTSYRGKIVILVDQNTISQSEFTVMALQSIQNTYVIGDTTAGADGNISPIFLPGGIQTAISGIGVLYPDGKETQRVGVKIDRIVKPTIAGVMSKHDEVLSAAVKYIQE